MGLQLEDRGVAAAVDASQARGLVAAGGMASPHYPLLGTPFFHQLRWGRNMPSLGRALRHHVVIGASTPVIPCTLSLPRAPLSTPSLPSPSPSPLTPTSTPTLTLILPTPHHTGSTCHATEPGWFRMCWAWVPGEALPVAVRRIRAVLDARKQQQQ